MDVHEATSLPVFRSQSSQLPRACYRPYPYVNRELNALKMLRAEA